MTEVKGNDAGTGPALSQYGAFVDPTPCLTLLQNWNAELIGFYLARLQQYAFLPQKLAACRSAQAIADVQIDFHRQLMDDYRHESGRLSDIAGKARDRGGVSDVETYAAELLKAQEDAKEIIRQAQRHAEQIIAGAQTAAAKPETEPAASTKAA